MDSETQTNITVGVVVVCIVTLLAVVVGPVFMRPRTVSCANACINNLRQIESGKEQAAMANGWTDGTDCDLPYNKVHVDAYIRGGGPVCPDGGTYRYNRIGELVTCSLDDPTASVRPHYLVGYMDPGVALPMPVPDAPEKPLPPGTDPMVDTGEPSGEALPDAIAEPDSEP